MNDDDDVINAKNVTLSDYPAPHRPYVNVVMYNVTIDAFYDDS